jgi:hypothetical protein
MALRLKFASLICGLALGLTAATHFIGWAYRDAPALGPRWEISEGLAVYPPWAFIGWHKRFGAEHRREFNLGLGIVLAGCAPPSSPAARGRAALTDLGRPEAQIDQHRLTPLDRELTYRRRALEAGRLPELFDERTEKALQKRATFLTAEGYASHDQRGLAFSSAGYAKLKDRDVVLSIQDQLETTKPLIGVARAQVSGAYVGAVSTASGVYAVLDRGAGLVAGRVAEAPGFALGSPA